MKTLVESLFDRDLIKRAPYKYHPKTKDELKDCIKKELDLQGPDANLNIIDVSEITDMSQLTYKIYDKIRNIDISLWDVSKVNQMWNMFADCKSFNCDLSKWDVSKVKDMDNMFIGCESFNCDLSKWDVSKVESMDSMFQDCTSFNSDLSNWDVRKVKDISNMFANCTSFNQDLSKWDVRKVKHAYGVFAGCTALKKIPSWYYEES